MPQVAYLSLPWGEFHVYIEVPGLASGDHRYFPEPDLPDLEITPQMIEDVKVSTGLLSQSTRHRWASA